MPRISDPVEKVNYYSIEHMTHRIVTSSQVHFYVYTIILFEDRIEIDGVVNEQVLLPEEQQRSGSLELDGRHATPRLRDAQVALVPGTRLHDAQVALIPRTRLHDAKVGVVSGS